MKNSHHFSCPAQLLLFSIVLLSFFKSAITIATSAQTPSVFREVRQAEYIYQNKISLSRLAAEIPPITPNGERDARRLDINEKRFAVFAESRSGKFACFSTGRDVPGEIGDFAVRH